MILRVYEGYEKYVYISFSHLDREIVYKFIDEMNRKNIRLWYEAGMAVESKWSDEMSNHITRSHIFIPFISENYMQSLKCKKELALAFHRNVKVLPIYLSDTTIPSVFKNDLESVKRIHLTDTENINQVVNRISQRKAVIACTGKMIVQQPPQKESKGGKFISNFSLKPILIVLLIAAIGCGGFFGYQYLQDYLPSISSDTQEEYQDVEREFVSYDENGDPDQVFQPIQCTFYYDQLSDKEKSLYDTCKNDYFSGKSKINMGICTNEEFQRVRTAIIFDCPEVFDNLEWFEQGGTYYADRADNKSTFEKDLEDVRTNSQNILDEIFSNQKDFSQYGLALSIYEYIINDVEYVADSKNNQDIRSVLFEHKSVCAGYARTYQYLCNLVGIDCATVGGYSYDIDSKLYERHAWNIVHLGDSYYYVDATWGDIELDNEPFILYDYLFANDSDFDGNHIISDNEDEKRGTYKKEDSIPKCIFTYPTCDKEDYNYYRLNGGIFDAVDLNQIYTYVNNCLNKDSTKPVLIKFSSKELFDQFENAYKNESYNYFWLVDNEYKIEDKELFGFDEHNLFVMK